MTIVNFARDDVQYRAHVGDYDINVYRAVPHTRAVRVLQVVHDEVIVHDETDPVARAATQSLANYVEFVQSLHAKAEGAPDEPA